MTTSEKISVICRHIGDVQKNCRILGERLIRSGEDDLGRELIANGMTHDNSKFFGAEWESLHPDASAEALKAAVALHNSSNPHHPEYWHGIKNMPPVRVAEMVCDWSARSAELGTSLLSWIDTGAPSRYGFTREDKVYRQISHFASMLCDRFK